MKIFEALWAQGNWDGVVHVIADKGYDCSSVRHLITKQGKVPIIPRRKGAICPGVRDKERYKTRHSIERFFAHIKENKRLCLRFDKLDATCLLFLRSGLP